MKKHGVFVTYHDPEKHIAQVTLDRPDKKNAMDEIMWSALEEAARILKDPLPRAVIVTGPPGGAFCAGMDVHPDNPQIQDFSAAVSEHDVDTARALLLRIRRAVDALASLPVPLIAAVNGIAYGGGAELAMRCDMRVMDPDAVICFSEVRMGLMPDWGGGVALRRIAGPAICAELILTARKVRADEALALGLVNRISPPGKCLEAAREMADTITQNGPRAVRAALRVIRESSDLPFEDALSLETEQASKLIATGECVTGISAFISGTQPDFPDASGDE
ncbi:MAG: enoyl-CoA hydratase/isomerase family protein [Deltaproteobacteria bacterium]|nr:enoyl-CoA hydratase/isomerase family protein [Candidatus Zymogenaceae bacterium]